MAAPAHAAEVKPLPKAAAKGGAEPRATHPGKAPQAPGWVSMASGVDGASTMVSSRRIGAWLAYPGCGLQGIPLRDRICCRAASVCRPRYRAPSDVHEIRVGQWWRI